MIDVLIAGGGPAGAVAGIILARRGVRVVIVDRARFPRAKLCGDTLNPGTMAILRRLDLADFPERHGLPIEGMIVTGQGVRVRAPYGDDRYGRAIERRDLDGWLLQEATRAGVQVDELVHVRGAHVDGASSSSRGPAVRGLIVASRDGRAQHLDARVTIAADGRRSTVAMGLGLLGHPLRPRRWAVGQYFDGAAGVTRFGEMHIREGCYIGVAPVPGGLINVCVVTDFGGRPGALGDPSALIRSALESDADLRDRFASARPATAPSVIGPLAVDARAAGLPGLLLAGDAAGFIDPLTGDGLRFAIRGAELAADAAMKMLEGTPAAHVELARQRARQFAGKWRFNRTLRVMVDSPRVTKAIAFAAARVPRVVQRLVAIAGDVPR